MALCYHFLPMWNCENPGKKRYRHVVPEYTPCQIHTAVNIVKTKTTTQPKQQHNQNIDHANLTILIYEFLM